MLELGGTQLPPTPEARREGFRGCAIERLERERKKQINLWGNIKECRIGSIEFYSMDRRRYTEIGGTAMGASSLRLGCRDTPSRHRHTLSWKHPQAKANENKRGLLDPGPPNPQP